MTTTSPARPPAAPEEDRPTRPRAVVLGVLAVAVALALGLVGGAWLTDRSGDDAPATPGTDSVDAGFARDMQVHHAQAVQMSVLVREATDDPEISTLALDIMLTQQQQVGQMFAWLRDWGLSQTASSRMGWMPMDMSGMDMSGMDMSGMDMSGMDMSGMDMSSGEMPGMATPAQIDRLSRLEGVAAERLYLKLMIPHHQGGVMMAQYAAENATDPEVRSLAEGIVAAQTAEITVLQDLLAARQG